jgi:hypothetical protein
MTASIFGRRRRSELREDARDVPLDGTRRDEHWLRIRLVRASLGDELRPIALARLERAAPAVATGELHDHQWIEG